MVVFKGRWHSVRKTVVGALIDKNGKSFKVRFLIDSGATVSMILMHSLFLTKGDWDFGSTPIIRMHGINAVSICDLMLEAKFMPGPHISSDFKTTMGIQQDFGVTMQFFVQRDVKAYKCQKQELTGVVLKELAKPEFMLADPDQATEGEEVLYVHGIIGEDQISMLEESNIRKIGDAGLKATRTVFGDMIHGNSHFLSVNNKKGAVEMRQKHEFHYDTICQYGLIAETSTATSQESLFENIDFLREISE